jgi:hypothetical protein
MFSVTQREQLRDRLVAAARADTRITAAAVVGSGALGHEDRWSDIDLALRLTDGHEPGDVAAAWTSRMYDDHGAADHLDVWSGPALYRVFLLSSSLQVDISFWPADRFAARGESFRLLFGKANEPSPAPPPDAHELVGTGWLYALHARSSIARGRSLQALYMINGVRDQVVSLACLRHNLSPRQGRGVDKLPADLRRMLATTLVGTLDPRELCRAFANLVEALLAEAKHADPRLELRIRIPARELVRTAEVGDGSASPG